MITVLEMEGDKAYLCRVKEGRRPRLVWSQEILREANLQGEGLGYFLKEIFESEGLFKDRLVLLLSPSQHYLRYIEIPVLRSHQIKKVLKFQMEKLIPSITAEEMILDYQILEKKNQTLRLLVVLARRETLSEARQVLDLIGKEADKILPESLALWEAYHRAGWIQKKKTLFLNVHNFQAVLIVTDEKPLYSRTFIFSQPGELEGEIRKSLFWMPQADRVDSTCVFSQDPLEDLPSDGLLGKIERPQPFEIFDPENQGKIENPIKKLALIGAGLSLGKSSLSLDLRQEEFQSIQSLLRIRWLVAGLLLWLNLVFLLGLVGSFQQAKAREKYYGKIIRFEKKWWKKIYPKRKTFPRQLYLRLIKKKIQRLSAKKGAHSLSSKQKGFLKALQILQKYLKAKNLLRFRRLALQKNALSLRGITANKEAFLALKQDLQKRENLAIKWDLTQVKRPGKTFFRFTLRLDLP